MSKSKNSLDLLFGSKARVKILKLLFRNPGLAFNAKELAVRVQEKPRVVSQEIRQFLELELLKIKK